MASFTIYGELHSPLTLTGDNVIICVKWFVFKTQSLKGPSVSCFCSDYARSGHFVRTQRQNKREREISFLSTNNYIAFLFGSIE